MHVECETIKDICDKNPNLDAGLIRMIGACIRCFNQNIMSSDDLSMLFQLNVNDLDDWMSIIQEKGVSSLIDIASSYSDARYKEWASSIHEDKDAPTFWIYEALEILKEKWVDKKDERLVLPFYRMLAYDISTYELSKVFCISDDKAYQWKGIGLRSLKKFMDK